MKAIRVHKTGGPEALQYEDVRRLAPRSGEVLVQLQTVGVNFIDVYYRSGVNPTRLPMTPGMEGAGVVMAVGNGVGEVSVGDLVAYTGAMGSYAKQAVVPAWRLVKLPMGIDATTAAAVLLQGMTAHYLSHSTFPLRRGHTALVHAGAGGVGLLLIQMAKRSGAYVFTTVSTEEKAALAREAGADHVILYNHVDFQEEITKATDGQGVNVVYDSVGKTTFDQSLKCLGRLGHLVLYGNSSGVVSTISPNILREGSLFLTRPRLDDYTATRDELLNRANEVFQWVVLGRLKVRIHNTYPLADAAEAHHQLEGRKTTGKLLLIP